MSERNFDVPKRIVAASTIVALGLVGCSNQENNDYSSMQPAELAQNFDEYAEHACSIDPSKPGVGFTSEQAEDYERLVDEITQRDVELPQRTYTEPTPPPNFKRLIHECKTGFDRNNPYSWGDDTTVVIEAVSIQSSICNGTDPTQYEIVWPAVADRLNEPDVDVKFTDVSQKYPVDNYGDEIPDDIFVFAERLECK